MNRAVWVLSFLFVGAGALDVRAQNVVLNPDFASNLNNWTVLPASSYTVAWDGGQGHDGAGTVFVNLTTDPGAGTQLFFLSQCVPVQSSETYTVQGSFRHPSVTAPPNASLIFTYYSGPGCSVSQIGGSDSYGLASTSLPQDTWGTATFAGVTPHAGAVSARILLCVTTFVGGLTSGWFDDITFNRTSPVELQQFTIE